MLKTRLIAVLILRDGQVVQSVRFKHTNVIHYDAVHAIDTFNRWSVDEIVMLNVDRSADGRGRFAEVVSAISRHCFVPLAAGGWITDDAYAQQLLRSGADKLVLNSAFLHQPDLVTRLSETYGAQCIVASIDFARNEDGRPEAMIDRGREATGLGPAEAAARAVGLGAGEILFNSIDHDGARRGYDLDSLAQVCSAVSVPVIAFGGVFTWSHLVDGLNAGANAVAAANIFHYTEHSTKKAKAHLAKAGIPVRQEGRAKA